MLFRVLGSGTCELRRERSSPAYLLETGQTALMLDLGQGAWRRLLQAGREPASLTGVLLSHPHLDHIADLIPLLFALKYDPELSAKASLVLMAHEGLGRMLEEMDRVFGGWLDPRAAVLERRWLTPGQETLVGEVVIKTAKAVHHAHSLAFRLEAGGSSLVYLGDSEASPELAEFAAGADLLICHCAGTDANPKPGHLHPAASGRLANQAEVGSLLLSHFYREVDPDQALESAARHFGGAIWAARDHLELILEPGKGCRQEDSL